MVGVVVHLDDQTVGAGGDRRACHRRHLVAAAHAVARVDEDRQMREFLDDRNGRQIEGVAREGFKGADAAFAQDHVGVAARQDVLRREQPLLHRRGDATLEQDRLARASQFAEQRVVLHVARADLVDVGVLPDHFDLVGVHHLGDQFEVVRVGARTQQLQPGLAQALEAVG